MSVVMTRRKMGSKIREVELADILNLLKMRVRRGDRNGNQELGEACESARRTARGRGIYI